MRRLIWSLSIAALLILALLRAGDPQPVQALREAYFDTLQRLSPRPYEPLPVRVVDIDEASLARIGQWPWPRDILADLADRLFEMGAASVAFDVLFAEPDRLSPARLAQDPRVREALGPGDALDQLASVDSDQRFADAIAGRPVILGVADAGADGTSSVQPRAGFAALGAGLVESLPPLSATTPLVPALDEAASAVGAVNVSRGETDLRVRDVPLVWNANGQVMPGLAIEALRMAVGESTYMLIGDEAEGAGLASVGLGEFTIPTSPDGKFRLHYRHDTPELYVSAADVLDPASEEKLRGAIEGNIVLVGTSAAGLLDIHGTALGERVPGVSIHAQAIEQILLGDYLQRDDVTSGAEILALITLGLLVTVVMTRFGPTVSLIAGGVAAAAHLSISWLAFTRYGVLFDATFPVLGGFVAFTMLAMLQYVFVDREKRLIRQSFTRYVAPEVLSEIERRGHRIDLGGEVRDVTVLFCDVRGFTALSETMGAQDLVAMLNDLFTKLSQEVLAGQGTIDKFIGDEIMAFWNAPLPIPDHARRACEAVLAMRTAAGAYSAARQQEGKAPIALAIGLATGPACVGNIGSRDRFNYTVIGETVNQAARVQAACRHVDCDILVTDDVARASSGMALLPAGRLHFKGVSQRVRCHVVVGDAAAAQSDGFRHLAQVHDACIAALTSGGAYDDLLTECRAAALAVDARLADFYDRLPDRRADFPAQRATQG